VILLVDIDGQDWNGYFECGGGHEEEESRSEKLEAAARQNRGAITPVRSIRLLRRHPALMLVRRRARQASRT
jgi:hypothetical protein